MMDLTCSFLVVTSGKPAARSKRIWWPNTERVPTPVRSRFSTPSASTRSMRSRYWRIGDPATRQFSLHQMSSPRSARKIAVARSLWNVLDEPAEAENGGNGKYPKRVHPDPVGHERGDDGN